MLLHFGIKPYLVFDGDNLPSKAETESKRSVSRQESRARGLEHLKFKRTSQAFLELRKAVDVTPEMAQMFIMELRRANVEYLVAPYEADSQLVYLEKTGIIDGILSEDSDLLVFGANCLLTKLDQYGECIMINRKDFTACREVSLAGWTDDQFRRMAILNGCDYLQGLNKIGLKTSYRLLRKHKTVENVVRALQLECSTKVPDGYLAAFEQAERTFLYQWVYCPVQQSLVHLNNLPPHIEASALPFIGKYVEKSLALGVSQGDLNPYTKKQMQREGHNISFTKATSYKKTIAKTPETKKSHTIESFFKVQRTPLAELDPNSFKPSPSQQGLLRDNPHRSWSAEHAPSRSQRSTDNFQSVSTGRRATSEVFSKQTPASYPSKRQKVYSERIEVPTGISAKQDLEVSPFFRSAHFASYTESPSIGLSKASNRTSKPEALLKSDDSIEEALGCIFDSNEELISPAKQRFKIYREERTPFDTDISVNADAEPDELQAPRMAQGVQEVSTEEGKSSLETNHSSTPDIETQATSVFSNHLSEEFSEFRSRFSYDSYTALNDDTRTASIAASRSSSSLSATSVCVSQHQNIESTMPATKSPHTSSIEVPVSSAPSVEEDVSTIKANKEACDHTHGLRRNEPQTDDLPTETHYSNETAKVQINGEQEDEEEEEDEEQEIALETPQGKKFKDFLYHEGLTELASVQAISPDQITKPCSVVPDSEDGSDEEEEADAFDDTGPGANVVSQTAKLLQGEETTAKPVLDLSRFKFAAACAGSV